MNNNSSGEMGVWYRRCESGDDWRFGGWVSVHCG